MIEPLLQAERLMLHGLIDQAEALYRSTVEADPRNAIAHVGLARVALERSEERQAYGHVCRALEMDPRNVIARRLEARLSEILAARGEPVERPAIVHTDAPPDLRPIVTGPGTAERGPGTADPGPGVEPTPEAAILARNRSMADHRRVDTRAQGQPPHDEPAPSAPGDAGPRRGLLRRLLGRR
jgi:hypothetical protein